MTKILELTDFEYSFDLEKWKIILHDKPFMKPSQKHVFIRFKRPEKVKEIELISNNGHKIKFSSDSIIEFDYVNNCIEILNKV